MENLSFTRKQFGALMALLGEMLSTKVTQAIFEAIDEVDPNFIRCIDTKAMLGALEKSMTFKPNETLLALQVLSVFADTDPGLTGEEVASFLGLKYEMPENKVVTATDAALYFKKMESLSNLLKNLK